jgi:hypothetical protein
VLRAQRGRASARQAVSFCSPFLCSAESGLGSIDTFGDWAWTEAALSAIRAAR